MGEAIAEELDPFIGYILELPVTEKHQGPIQGTISMTSGDGADRQNVLVSYLGHIELLDDRVIERLAFEGHPEIQGVEAEIWDSGTRAWLRVERIDGSVASYWFTSQTEQ